MNPIPRCASCGSILFVISEPHLADEGLGLVPVHPARPCTLVDGVSLQFSIQHEESLRAFIRACQPIVESTEDLLGSVAGREKELQGLLEEERRAKESALNDSEGLKSEVLALQGEKRMLEVRVNELEEAGRKRAANPFLFWRRKAALPKRD